MLLAAGLTRVSSFRLLGMACRSGILVEQHLDNLRRKDSLTGAETPERAVRLGNYSASHFEGAAYKLMRGGRARWKIENETFNTLKNPDSTRLRGKPLSY